MAEGMDTAMIKFYQKVDCRSRRKMTEFLQKHFRYNTMSSSKVME